MCCETIQVCLHIMCLKVFVLSGSLRPQETVTREDIINITVLNKFNLVTNSLKMIMVLTLLTIIVTSLTVPL